MKVCVKVMMILNKKLLNFLKSFPLEKKGLYQNKSSWMHFGCIKLTINHRKKDGKERQANYNYYINVVDSFVVLDYIVKNTNNR